MVIVITVLLLFAGISVAAWFWWRKHKAGRPRVLRDTTHLGPFVNLSLLSDKGGMAKIYRATNSETNRDCVLKVLRSEMLGNPEVVKKFRREADILQSIKQAAPDAPVVLVYSTGTISTSFVELPYIEMEFIPGGMDLSDYLRNHPQVDPHAAATIVAQVVQALRCADGIAVHRDLKPGNIMLANGDPCRVVVCDFGVAKEMDSRSISQSAFGTAAYMAPEQCVPDGRVSAATDIYALGVIWYRMLTGSLLFDDTNPLVVMRAHVERDPRAAIESMVPEPYRELLLRMLAKSPGDRPGYDEIARLLPETGRWVACLSHAGGGDPEQTAVLSSGRPGRESGTPAAGSRPRANLRRFAPHAVAVAAACLVGIVWVVTRGGPAKPPTPVPVPPPAQAPKVPAAPAVGTWEVNSSPSGAEVRVDERVAGTTPLAVALLPGEHRVRVRLDGYEPFESSASVQPGQAGAVHAALVPLPASLTFTSTPSGAEIVVDGTALGTTPVRMGSVKAGKYQVSASLEGLPGQERSIVVRGGQQATVTFNFEQARGLLSVRSEPKAADIVLDDSRLVGVTPVERLPLPVGSYVLVARAPGFREFRTTVDILRGEERRVDITLEQAVPSEGYLTVDVQPLGAVVHVDGTMVGVTPLNGLRLPSGEHLLSVSSPGRPSLERRVRVTVGQTERVSGSLGSAVTDVDIVSEPPGFDVHFDGVPRGKTPLTLADQPHGRHRVALVQGGRLRWQGEVTLDGSREREVVRAVVADDALSQPIRSGSISVNVTNQGKPGWGTVVVDGTSVGNSPVLLKDLEPREYRLRVQRPGFQRSETVVTLSSGERKLVSVDLVPE